MEFCAASCRLQPGFRFHPTNVELLMYYLKRKVLRKVLKAEMITEVDVYQFHPKDLRELACLKKDLNWYFFCPRGKKYGCGVRTNRATQCGYWKATGNDRDVSYEDRIVGKIKTLVFHEGKPPKGKRTDWVMHEYRLEDKKLADAGVCQDSYVLCKIFEKSGLGPKNAEQYGAPFIEEEWDEEEEEIFDCEQVMHIGDHNQSTSVEINSAVTSVLLSVNACPVSTSEHAYSGAVSVSAVDQAPLVPNAAAANIASSSKSSIPYYECAMDQILPTLSVAGNLVSSSNGPSPNYNYPAVWASSPMPNDAAIASTSAGPVPFNDEDEMDRLLDMFVVGDEGGVFESLEDPDQTTAQGPESSCWRNFDDNSILHLSDLVELLIPL